VFVRTWVMCACALGCASAGTIEARREAVRALASESRAVHPARSRSGPTCDSIARAVLREHPRLRAAESRARSALAQSVAEASLPPPSLRVEVWDFPIGDPGQADREGMYMVGVEQEFPPAGVRDHRARAAAEEARALAGERTDLARRIYGEVAHACVDWSASKSVLDRARAHRDLLRDARDAVVAAYRGGAQDLGAVARADAELATADRGLAREEATAGAARSTLAALAGPIEIPAEPPALDASIAESIDVDSQAVAARGDVTGAAARVRRAGELAGAADAEASSPAFELGVTYMQTPGSRAGIGAMVSMSLPWLWGGGSDAGDAAAHEVAATESELEAIEWEARVEIARALGAIREAIATLAALREHEIPAAERALEAERAAVSSGRFTLDAWIRAAHMVRQAHVDEAEARRALEHARIDLATAAGAPFVRGPR
jgi:outer membrane protein TolC